MSEKTPGFFGRLWRALRRPPAKTSLLTLILVIGIGGIVVWNVFYAALESTNSMEFCVSCHSMRGNLEEYKKTIHYENRSGVRAICSDCHVPHDFVPKILRKLEAANDVWGEITGIINTPEKFEANRIHMAEREWKRFENNGSANCRRCHNFDAMSKEKQGQTRFNKHMKAKEEGKTCIDCHKGSAHKLPKEYHDPDEEE
jgi:cytochrome c-type protein NapC